jgi:hypothetical protein
VAIGDCFAWLAHLDHFVAKIEPTDFSMESQLLFAVAAKLYADSLLKYCLPGSGTLAGAPVKQPSSNS